MFNHKKCRVIRAFKGLFKPCLNIFALCLLVFLMAGKAEAAAIPPTSDRKETLAPIHTDTVLPAEKYPIGPAVQLTKYQINWIQDQSRFKIAVITRQGGKSFGTSLEAVLDCVERKTMWVFLSAGETQSKELMAKAAMHARAIGHAVAEIENEFLTESGIKYKQLEIVFPNGSRIVGLPANPDTARGWSANILLDEFAQHKDSREIWKAMFPTVTRGYKIRIISTFKGKSNKFYEMFFGAPTLQKFTGTEYEYVGQKGGWSKHFINIYQAIEMGLELRDEEGKPCDTEDLRLALNDDDAWAEEFECIPSDEASAWLSHDLISSVEDVTLEKTPLWAEKLVAAAEENYREFMRTKIEPALPRDVLADIAFLGELYCGFDVARKRDLSVVWLDQKIGGVLRQAAAIDLKNKPYFVQEHVLFTLLERPEMRRTCIDETGLGNQLAERAQDRYGSHKIEKITFNLASKEALATGIKRNFEDRGSAIASDNVIRRSLHSVKKYPTSTGHFRFDSDRTEEIGHADHFWAKALSTQAASNNVQAACAGSDPAPRETMTGGRRGMLVNHGGIMGRFKRTG